MRLLKNRKIAILITVVLVVFATLFGVGRSLNRLTGDIEAMFYDGVPLDGEGFLQPGIDAHLNNRLNSALGFAVLMEGYPEADSEAKALLSARNELISAKTISEKYKANEALQQAYLTLQAKTETLELSNRDKDDVAKYSSSFSGAQTAILNSSYNRKAESFMDGASFFARILKPFAFVTPPQAFTP